MAVSKTVEVMRYYDNSQHWYTKIHFLLICRRHGRKPNGTTFKRVMRRVSGGCSQFTMQHGFPEWDGDVSATALTGWLRGKDWHDVLAGKYDGYEREGFPCA